MFAITSALALVNSVAWPGTFFAVTMVCVVIINIANGVYQNCIYGAVAVLPMSYTNTVVTGMNISGVFTAILSVRAASHIDCSTSILPR